MIDRLGDPGELHLASIADLVEVSASPAMVSVHIEFFRMMFASHVSRLHADGTLTSRQADRW